LAAVATRGPKTVAPITPPAIIDPAIPATVTIR